VPQLGRLRPPEGEEFSLLVSATVGAQAIVAAERIRETLELTPVVLNDAEIRVTVSIGVATSVDPAATSPAALLNRADSFVYAAKEAVRNRVAGEDLRARDSAPAVVNPRGSA